MKATLFVLLAVAFVPQEVAPDPFARAVAAYRAGQYDEALAGFSAAWQQSPAAASPELLGNLALAALRQRRPADAEAPAQRLADGGHDEDAALGEFLLGQAAMERARTAELAARLPDAEPMAWQAAVMASQHALDHWRRAAELRPGWPEAVRNAERAYRRLTAAQDARDRAEQQTRKEKAKEPTPPQPKNPTEADTPDLRAEPLPAAEVARLLERLQQKEREKVVVRQQGHRAAAVGGRGW